MSFFIFSPNLLETSFLIFGACWSSLSYKCLILKLNVAIKSWMFSMKTFSWAIIMTSIRHVLPFSGRLDLYWVCSDTRLMISVPNNLKLINLQVISAVWFLIDVSDYQRMVGFSLEGFSHQKKLAHDRLCEMFVFAHIYSPQDTWHRAPGKPLPQTFWLMDSSEHNASAFFIQEFLAIWQSLYVCLEESCK